MWFSSSNIQWDIEPNPPIQIKEFKGYDKPHGPSFPTPTSILQVFTLIFTNELVSNIVTETNRYAQVCLKEKFEEWKCVTSEEMYAYFGFLILMGMVNLPSIRDYWRRDITFNYWPLSSRISRTRFLDIHRFIHFVNNDSLPTYGDPNYSKIQKVKPILTYISSKLQNLFVPDRDVAVDEAMVKYKGRSSIKQYMPQKPVKRGFKIWMLADSATGYVLKFTVYEGKTGNSVERGLGANVVKRLTEHLQNKYHHVYFDNFFYGHWSHARFVETGDLRLWNYES